jgi:hypothetical protein
MESRRIQQSRALHTTATSLRELVVPRPFDRSHARCNIPRNVGVHEFSGAPEFATVTQPAHQTARVRPASRADTVPADHAEIRDVRRCADGAVELAQHPAGGRDEPLRVDRQSFQQPRGFAGDKAAFVLPGHPDGWVWRRVSWSRLLTSRLVDSSAASFPPAVQGRAEIRAGCR